MRKQKQKTSHHFRRALGFPALLVVATLAVLSLVRAGPARAAPGTNQQLNYQARLLTSEGAVVPDGLYNIEFKIYQDGDGVLGGGDETLEWTETRTTSNRVTVKNGYFSVYLGSITPFGSSVDWNQDTLWLSINIGGTAVTPAFDGEMSPYTRLSSTPYAINSSQLGGLTSDKFVQLRQGQQTDDSANASIHINDTGGGNFLHFLSGGTDQFTVSNTGTIAAATALNTINGIIIDNGAVSGVTDLTASGAITTSGNISTTGLGAITSAGLLTASSGLSIINGGASITGGLNNNSGGITNAGSVAGVTSLSASGNITTSGNISTTGTGTITSAGLITASNGLTVSTGNIAITAGLLSTNGVTRLTNAGALTNITGLTIISGGASITGGLNNNSGGITNAGSVAGVTSLSASGNISTSAGVYQQAGLSGVSAGTCASNNYLGGMRVSGGIVTDAGTCNGVGLSDERLKQNVAELDSTLGKINDINLVTFDFKCDHEAFTIMNESCKEDRQTGVLAQQLATVFPELVYEDEFGYMRVKYDALNIYTLRATQGLASMLRIEGGRLVLDTASQNGFSVLGSGGEELFALDAEGNAVFAGNVSGGNTVSTTNVLAAIDQKVQEFRLSNQTFSGVVAFSNDVNFANFVRFAEDVEYAQNVYFKGRPIFNKDTAGFAVIEAGDNEVRVTFHEPYSQVPVINASNTSGSYLPHTLTDVDETGFTIAVQVPVVEDLEFNWTAFLADQAVTFLSGDNPPEE